MRIQRILIAMAVAAGSMSGSTAADHVIMISVDGFRPAAIEELLGGGELTNFGRLQAEGAWTHNARTDFDSTSTVPNHVSMVTGRGVSGADGHNYTSNGNPAASATIAATKGSYVYSVFDVAHDHGLTTSLHRSKTKLAIIDQSYSDTAGAADTIGNDDGRGKIDTVEYREVAGVADTLVDQLELDLLANPVHLAFVHLVDPDREGHGSKWDTVEYKDAVRRIDGYLGRLLTLVESNAPYAGNTTIILTADHGGEGGGHTDASNSENYVIPFYVWGADVPTAADLYEINGDTRSDPAGDRPEYAAMVQPIRNGDIGNLALDLLGLPSIPGSTINADQNLSVVAVDSGANPQVSLRVTAAGAVELTWFSDRPATVQVSGRLGGWTNAAGAWPSLDKLWVDPQAVTGARYFRIVFD